jgi:hypothetical protein
MLSLLQCLPPEADGFKAYEFAARYGEVLHRDPGPAQGVQAREGAKIGQMERPCFTGPALGLENGLGVL